MPVDTSLYSDNWNSLALKVKEAAQWQCQCCGKKCYERRLSSNCTETYAKAGSLAVSRFHLLINYATSSCIMNVQLCADVV
jgi:hypothetical protein